MPSPITFFDVEQHVFGNDRCTPDELTRFYCVLQDCIVRLFASCQTDNYYQKRFMVTIPAGSQTVELQAFYDAAGCTITQFKKMQALIPANEEECKEEVCIDLTEGETKPTSVEGHPSFFELCGDVIQFDCVPIEEIELHVVGYREADCEITKVTPEGATEYQVPDIPEMLYPTLKAHAAAMWKGIERGDWSNAAPELQLVDTSFDTVKQALDQRRTALTGDRSGTEQGMVSGLGSDHRPTKLGEDCGKCGDWECMCVIDRSQEPYIYDPCVNDWSPARVRRSHEWLSRRQA